MLHDVLTTLRRRFPAIPVLLYPVPVQGAGAAERIAAAIRTAGERRDCDVLILARGGGSLEDLWAFNEEAVARAIVACPVPIVCGVGHETDFTIADLAADVRAPTPTAAAELASPHQGEWLERFRGLETRLVRLIEQGLRDRAQRIDWLAARLVHPRARIDTLSHRLVALRQRLALAQTRNLHGRRARLHELQARLDRCTPLPAVRARALDCRHLYERLRHATRVLLEQRRQQLGRLGHALNAFSPLATLDRGYAIVRHAATGAIVRDAESLAPGERVEARLARGVLECIVERRRPS